MRHHLAQVDHGQQGEDVGLQERDKRVQAHKDDWDSNGNQPKEHQKHHLARKHIGVQTDGE